MDDDKKLTEEDIRLLFKSEDKITDSNSHTSVPIKYEKKQAKDLKIPKTSWVFSLIKTLGLFILIFSFSFGIINYPALYLKARYFFDVKTNNNLTPVPTPTPTPTSNESFLIIPKIAVKVPIIWNVPGDETVPALQNGVAHFSGTALPGQIGNVFISGHSSYYWWDDGKYKEVFALLEEMEKGDRITVDYKGIIYTYEVSEKKVVKPNDVDVLNQQNERILSLMTCVPVGTNLNRLIVIAKQL